jgi:hypothetical protein
MPFRISHRRHATITSNCRPDKRAQRDECGRAGCRTSVSDNPFPHVPSVGCRDVCWVAVLAVKTRKIHVPEKRGHAGHLEHTHAGQTRQRHCESRQRSSSATYSTAVVSIHLNWNSLVSAESTMAPAAFVPSHMTRTVVALNNGFPVHNCFTKPPSFRENTPPLARWASPTSTVNAVCLASDEATNNPQADNNNRRIRHRCWGVQGRGGERWRCS